MTDRNTSGREPFEWIELHQSFCSERWGNGSPNYPLDDDGTTAALLGSGYLPLSMTSPDFVTGTLTMAGVAKSYVGAPRLERVSAVSPVITATSKIACEFGIDALPAGDFFVALIIQECEADGTINATRRWEHSIGKISGTQLRAGFGPSGFVFGDGSFASPDTKRIGIEVDIAAGKVYYRASGEVVQSSSITPAVGKKIFAWISIDDQTTATTGQTISATLYPAGHSMLLTYGTDAVDMSGITIAGQVAGNCTALLIPGGEKCHNTISSCARTDKYAEDTLVLRFCSERVRLPADGNYYFPLLETARVTPCSINPGGGNTSKGSIGTRAKLACTFKDGPHSDAQVDPYLSDRLIGAARYDGVAYNPFERSTFWRKWTARNLYKVNRKIVHNIGYMDADGTVSDVVTRTFYVSGFSGPDENGRVSFEGEDLLAKIDNEKAQAPEPSSGKLSAGITSGSGSLTLTPAGVGDLEYPASGYGCIGDEVVAFTRTGDTVTLTGRGQFNTAADAHDAGDTFQLCLHISAMSPDDILKLLLSYAGISETEHIDSAQWDAETYSFLPRLYSTLIPKPTGVYQLVSEVSEQMYLYIWLDERDNLLKLRAVRPAEDEVVTLFTEDSLQSLTSQEQPEQRISRVVINYGIRDYTKDLDEPTNYAVTDIIGEFGEEAPERSGSAVSKVINSRWLTSTDGAAATELGERLLARYKLPPRKLEFELDAKDRDLWVGDFVSIETVQHVDRFGVPVPIPAQVMAVTEAVPGTTFRYEAQQFVYEEPVDKNYRSIEVAADDTNLDLRALHDLKYATAPTAAMTIVFTVRSGVIVGSTTNTTPAIDVGSWPSEVNLQLVNYGYIVGKGGYGGDSATSFSTIDRTTRGEDGGPALSTGYPLTLENYGVIGGGGGGGGGFGISYLGSPAAVYGAGGGAGYTAGPAGMVSKGGSNATMSYGAAGTLETGGYGSAGNNGGDLGQAGAPAADNPYSGGTDAFGKRGGLAGDAIQGASFVTFTVAGDIRGAQTG